MRNPLESTPSSVEGRTEQPHFFVGTRGQKQVSRKVKVVLGVRPRSLMHVVEYLLGSDEDLQIVFRSSQKKHLLTYAGNLLPELIVVSTRLMGKEVTETVAEIKRVSPKSRLILISPYKELHTEMRRCGADADLPEDSLVKSLPPLVRRMLQEQG